MKFRFGSASTTKLQTCHPTLQHLMHAVMAKQLMDFSVIYGHRDEAAQNTAYRTGASKKRWPDSKHNSLPSIAVDIAPYPIRWGYRDDPRRIKAISNFYRLAGIVLATAREMDIPIRWGGDWNMDGDIYDNDFDDLVHFELRP